MSRSRLRKIELKKVKADRNLNDLTKLGELTLCNQKISKEVNAQRKINEPSQLSRSSGQNSSAKIELYTNQAYSDPKL